jgi:hypothetical protein
MFRQEVVAESNEHKWSQGCLLKAPSVKLPWLTLANNVIVPSQTREEPIIISSSPLSWRIEHRTLDEEDFLVVVSQTCDVRRLANKEPYIEAIRAFWTDDKSLINEAKTNSIRHFALQFRDIDKKQVALIADATIRVQIEKDSLITLEPIICFREDDKATPLLFRQWLAERYGRQAVPDEFVNAVQKPIVKAVKKLKLTDNLFRIFGGFWKIQYFIRNDERPYQVEMLFIEAERKDMSPLEAEDRAKLADWISIVLGNNGGAELVYWEALDTRNIRLYDFLHSYELPLDSYTLSGEYEDS